MSLPRRIHLAILRHKVRKASKKGDVIDMDLIHEETDMNVTLLIAFAGSIARHFLPWATALLAGMGYQASPDASPLTTLGLAVAVYLISQGVSLVRQWRKNKA